MDHIVEVSSRSASDDVRDPLFAPLRAPVPAGCSFVLGRVAQSLDGYIATREGESVWISGPDDLRLSLLRTKRIIADSPQASLLRQFLPRRICVKNCHGYLEFAADGAIVGDFYTPYGTARGKRMSSRLVR